VFFKSVPVFPFTLSVCTLIDVYYHCSQLFLLIKPLPLCPAAAALLHTNSYPHRLIGQFGLDGAEEFVGGERQGCLLPGTKKRSESVRDGKKGAGKFKHALQFRKYDTLLMRKMCHHEEKWR
jgi:hypothetical protein